LGGPENSAISWSARSGSALRKTMPARTENFVTAMCAVRTQRLRDGAYRWGFYNDAATPNRFVETFVVES